MNNGDYIVIAILTIWAIVSVIYMVRRKKKGKSITCSGDCANCAGCKNIKK